jgi:hypothetical protein
MGIEGRATAASDLAIRTRTGGVSITINRGDLGTALGQLTSADHSYAISTADAVINVGPPEYLAASDHFLNRPILRFQFHDITLAGAIHQLRHAMNPAYDPANVGFLGESLGAFPLSPQPTVVDPTTERQQAAAEAFDAMMDDTKITIDMVNVSPRQILNRLALQNGALIWRASYEGATAGDADCVLSVSTFDGPILYFGPHAGR